MARAGTITAFLDLNTKKFMAKLKRTMAQAAIAGRMSGNKVGWSMTNGMSQFFSGRPLSFISESLQREIMAAREGLNQLIRSGYIIGPVITVIGSAIGGLASALTSLVSVVGAATPALMALGNSLSALVQGGIVVQQAMRGVAEAIAIEEPPEGPDRVADALDRVRDARIRLRNIINKEQPERLAAARERAAEAESRAADALRSSEAALRSYNEAQKRTVDAIEALNEARDRARERIQQLRFETEGAAISEKQARLSFERARDSLQAVQDLPPNSRARQEAELAFAEADLNLRRAIDRNSDLKKEEEAATQAGVEGSDEVVAAKEAIERATQAEADAQYNAARAYLAAAKARKEADKAAQDASAGGAVQQQIDADIARAREQLKDALEDLEDARNSGGANQLEEALKKLSPAARDFVLYMRDIKKEFNILRDSAATGFFPLLRTSVELVRGRLDDLGPMFESTGKSAGQASQSIAGAFTEAQTFGNIQTIWSNNNRLIEIFGRTIGNLVRGISALLVAAGPLTERFARFIETVSGRWATRLNNDIDGQTERFNAAGEIARRLGGILADLGRVFGEIGEIVMAPGGAGESILTFFEQGTEGLLKFLDAGSPDGGDGSLVQTFKTATDNGLKLLEILGDLVVILFDLSASENFSAFLESIDSAVVTFGGIAQTFDETLPAFGELIEQVSILLASLTESGGAEAFFIVITEAVRSLNEILANETVRKIFLVLAKIKGVTLAFGTLFKVGKFFLLGLSGPFVFLAGKISALGGAFFKFGIFLARISGGTGPLVKVAAVLFRIGNAMTFLAAKPILFLKVAIVKLAAAMSLPLLPWILLGAGIVAVGVIIFKFRKQIANFVKGIIDWFKNLYNRLVGNSIIPDMVNGIVEWITGLWEKFTDLVKNGVRAVVDFFKELPGKVFDALQGLATKVWDFIKYTNPVFLLIDFAVRNWEDLKIWFRELPGKIVDTLRGLTTRVRDFIRDYHPILILLRFVQDKWPELKNWLTTRIDGIAEWFTGLPDKIRRKVRNMWDGLKDAFRETLNWLIRKWNDFKIELRLPNEIFGIPLPPGVRGAGYTLETPNIPLLAAGGIVPAVRGGLLAILGEGGQRERVEPLDKDGLSKRDKAMIDYMGGRGVTVNVYPSPGMDEAALAEMVSRRLAQELRVGAA